MAASKTKWAEPPVHPAADKLPLMGQAELKDLAEDIKANGLQEPIILWTDNGSKDAFLLDGRNRMAALKLLGITDPYEAPPGKIVGDTVRTLAGVDPEKFVSSMNVYRRHLTTEQKRDYVTALIAVDPKASDRSIARKAGVDNKTVAKARAEADRNEEIPQTDHSPLDRAKAAILAQPNASQRVIATEASVGQATVSKAHKELVDSGEIVLEPVDKPKAKPKAKAAPKPKPAPKPKVEKPTPGTLKVRAVAVEAAELESIFREMKRCNLTAENITVLHELLVRIHAVEVEFRTLQAKA